MTPKQSGIPYLIADGGQPYKIAGCILESHTWQDVQQKGNKFFYREGHALMDFDHDFMVFLYQYREEQVAASVRDEFVKARNRLPRWTRTRWLAGEHIEDSFRNGLLLFSLYDYRARKPVSQTCRGIKKINRLMASGECRFSGTEEAFRQVGLED